MKNILTATAITFFALFQATAKEAISPVGIGGMQFDREGDMMVVNMDFNLAPVTVKSRNAEIITPLIINGEGRSLELPSIGVYGRQRYVYLQRNRRVSPWSSPERSFKMSEQPDSYAYFSSVPYEDWMSRCRLVIRRSLYSCVNCLVEERCDTVDTFVGLSDPMSGLSYMASDDTGPVVESLEGAAYIDFVVNKTDINPAYRNNPAELMKIQASIDTVLNDNDVKITSVWLKGFASPESPYAHNARLAVGRTDAIRRHIRQLYNFAPDLIKTDYEPEDWEGLRRLVANSNIENKAGILEIIDSNMEPDPKEALIKKKYPAEYKFMLDNFYPALRHTDYKITYEVKRFDDIDKIRQVMLTRPNRLTLRELYLLAETCEPGSDEYNDIFETAVRIYPDDPVANTNAANAAIKRKDFDRAEKYLARAGDSDEARYGRAVLALSREDYDQACEILKTLTHMPYANRLMEEVSEILKYRALRAANASGRMLD